MYNMLFPDKSPVIFTRLCNNVAAKTQIATPTENPVARYERHVKTDGVYAPGTKTMIGQRSSPGG